MISRRKIIEFEIYIHKNMPERMCSTQMQFPYSFSLLYIPFSLTRYVCEEYKPYFTYP